jgi:fatty-acyl-CoA synthase
MNVLVTMLLSSTLVLTERFDPEATLALVEREQCDVLVAVPVMLTRLLALPPELRGRHDTSSLEVVAVSGSALSGELATRFMDAYGDVLHNLYGSTEASFATVAGPRDLRAAPGTAGRALAGVRVRVVDGEGGDVPTGQVGEVVVRSGTVFGGYTSGEDRPRSGGGVRVGDLGRFDEQGRLFLVGRADDMVVTGGENVYPITVEHALERHPDVAEVAAVGEPDDELGAALVAHVHLSPGSAVGPDELREWSKQHLARHEVPRRVVVHPDPLPRNAAGKVVKRDL